MEYVHKIKIGNVELENNIILAPMAGITDLPFRIICKKYSNPGLVYTEMVSSKSLVYGNKKTRELLDIESEKRPIAFQIFGSNVNDMIYAIREIAQSADIIDINMGCPAPKIVKNGDGSKLLLSPDLVGYIVSKVVQNTDKPVTVKIRKGWDKKNVNAVEIAKIIESAGAAAITVHGRTREEYYSRKCRFRYYKKSERKCFYSSDREWRCKNGRRCQKNDTVYKSGWSHDRKGNFRQSLANR